MRTRTNEPKTTTMPVKELSRRWVAPAIFFVSPVENRYSQAAVRRLKKKTRPAMKKTKVIRLVPVRSSLMVQLFWIVWPG